MNILCISEHFHPVLGGTTTYVERSCEALQQQGHRVRLLFPGANPLDQSLNGTHLNFETTALGLGVDIRSGYSRKLRYHFCGLVEREINRVLEQEKIDVIHVLFGLFLNERLPVRQWRQKGVKVVTTIHNIPPQECGISWPGDKTFSYQKDRLRKQLVKVKNHARIKAHEYDAWITPSHAVRRLLEPLVPPDKIQVIGHGYKPIKEIPAIRDFRQEKQLRILTVGGLVPHKNQHLIVPVAEKLQQAGIDFRWDIIGPARIGPYVQFIQQQIAQSGLSERVSLRIAVPFDELDQAYRTSNLYVQPSAEEGFCMTALDAAMYGLPIVGSPAGAIPEIIALATGILAELQVEALYDAIEHIHLLRQHYQPTTESRNHLMQTFNWEHAVQQLETVYEHNPQD